MWNRKLADEKMSRATAALTILRKGNAASDKLASVGRHDDAYYVLSFALQESYKEYPRADLNAVLGRYLPYVKEYIG